MRMPGRMPAVRQEAKTTLSKAADRRLTESARQIAPAACCAEACVNVPFVGRVCHCVLDLPVCP